MTVTDRLFSNPGVDGGGTDTDQNSEMMHIKAFP